MQNTIMLNSYKCSTISNKKQLNYLFVVFIEMLFVLYKITTFAPLFFVSTLLLAIYLLFVKEKDFILTTFALLPSALLMKYTNTGAAVLGYCVLLAELKYIIFRKKAVKLANLIPLLVLAFSFLITVIANSDFSFIMAFVRFFASITYIFTLIEDGDFIGCIKNEGVHYFVFGAVVNVLLGIIFVLVQRGTIFGGNFSGISIDRNYFSSLVSVAIAFVTIQLFTEKKKALNGSFLFLLLFGGLLSASRTFFISLLFPLLSIVCFVFMKEYRKTAVIITLLLSFAFAVSIVFLKPLYTTVFDRFMANDVAGGNGRYVAWQFYLANTFSNPFKTLFGGSSKLDLYVTPVVWGVGGYTTVQHNTLIESISEIGLFGTVFLIILFVLIFRRIRGSGKKKIVMLAPLLSLLLCYFFINGLFSDTLTFVMLLCFIFYKCQNIHGEEIRSINFL